MTTAKDIYNYLGFDCLGGKCRDNCKGIGSIACRMVDIACSMILGGEY